MSEILVKFDEAIPRAGGTQYFAQAMTRKRDDNLWEGWLVFSPATESGTAVSSGRETTQPNRNAVMYWAQGLTRVYLMGALERALAPNTSTAREREALSG